MHNLLKRQLKKCFGDSFQIPADWQRFIDAVNDAYVQSDTDRSMIERSLDLSSRELLHANSDMRTLISLLNATIESTADGILVVNRKGEVISFNQKFLDMWKIPRQVIDPRDDDQLLSFVVDQVKDPEGFVRKISELYDNPEAESHDEIIFMDGSVFERYSKPQRIGRAVVGRVWSFRDVTDRRRAEEVIRESETRYRNLFENAHDLIQSVNQEGHFIYVNRAWVKTMGYTLEEVSRLSLFDILHESCLPHCMEIFKKVISGMSIDIIEAIFVAKDGRLINVEGNVNARFLGGKIVGSQGIFRDVTDRKRAEEERERLQAQLVQSQKMEAVGQLAGGIAHDFNNILNAIIGYGSMLKLKIKEDDPLMKYANRVLSLSEKAGNLTRSLLAFSRKQIMNPRPADLNDIIRKVERLLARVISEDIELKIVLSGEELTVMADSIQIEQVLMNLATNARDAMNGGGLLTIRTEIAEVDDFYLKTLGLEKAGMYALISVTDTGLGIDEATRAHIFEPFFTTKEVGKGTGLGLSIVYGIIKQHEGSISVNSEQGKGTTFRIYLPLIQEKGEGSESEVMEPISRGSETILLAEDDNEVRASTKDMLEDFGYRVIEAADGEEAVNIFNAQKDKIHLAILDVIMPRKNGKEAYTEMKMIKSDLRAIFISGYTADIMRQKGILAENIELVLKPMAPQLLLAKIRGILDKH